MKKCYVFPGQGGQSVGMGKELYEKNPFARAVFDEVDAALGEKLSDIMFNGNADELNMTKNLQPSVFAVSMAIWKAASAERALLPEFVAGHSLGEYSALCAADAVGISDCARILRKRGELMQSAVPVGMGAMAVIIGGDGFAAEIEGLCKLCGLVAAECKGVCELANDNGVGQFVISGNTKAVEKAMEISKTKGAKIAKMLAVSVPAHSSMMEPIVREMQVAVNNAAWESPIVPFISNKTADVMTDISVIKEALLYQLTHGVRWRESVLYMAKIGVEEIIEVGPGNVLTGLNKRIVPELNCYKLEI